MTQDWGAATYDRISDPMYRWGIEVFEWLQLAGDETVLDAGCGSGRVTEVLAERLSRGRVIALDRSATMLAQARRRLARFGNHVVFILADLSRPLPIRNPVDAILSTATFHWIPDHEALFCHLAGILRPGGQLAAQCGGTGNIRSVLEAARQAGVDAADATTFAGVEETRARLAAAGFVEIEVWLESKPTPLPPGVPWETYLRTVCLREHLKRIPPTDGDSFVRRVAALLPRPQIDYVRLNIRARRPSGIAMNKGMRGSMVPAI